MKNPRQYNWYKTGCGRVERLKNVWGLKEYDRFHSHNVDEDILVETGASSNATANEKNTPKVDTRLPDFVRLPIIAGSVFIVVVAGFLLLKHRWHRHQHYVRKKSDVDAAGGITLT